MTQTLIADGADTTRVVLRVTDEFDAIRPFANDAIQFSIEGPAEIIGDNPFSLVGGTGAIWVRAKEQAGKVRLTADIRFLASARLNSILLLRRRKRSNTFSIQHQWLSSPCFTLSEARIGPLGVSISANTTTKMLLPVICKYAYHAKQGRKFLRRKNGRADGTNRLGLLRISGEIRTFVSHSCKMLGKKKEPTMTAIPTTEVRELTSKYTYGTWRLQKGWNPVHVADAEGCYFMDGDGKKYLDFSGQLMCVTLGHKNPAVVKAIQDQAEKLAFIGPGFATEARAALSKLLMEVLPKGLEKFFFTTSGTEANEAAFKIARMVTGKPRSSPAIVPITAQPWEPWLPRVIRVAGRWSQLGKSRE